MPRSIHPYFRSHDGYWYACSKRFVEFNGSDRVKLLKGSNDEAHRLLAQQKLAELLARLKAKESRDEMPVSLLAAEFLAHHEGEASKEHHAAVKRIVENFAARFGSETVAAFDVKAVRNIGRWLSANRSWRSGESQRRAIATVKAMFAYGRKHLGLAAQKVSLVKSPKFMARVTYFAKEQEAVILGALALPRFRDNGEFADFFRLLMETGARTYAEAAKFSSANLEWIDGKPVCFDLGEVKRRQRLIYLSPVAQEIVSRLIDRYPQGPLLRNADGNPWTKSTASRRLRAVIRYLMKTRPDLGLTTEHSLYSCRHSFIVRKLISTKGDVGLVAEMAGNTIAVLERHYKKWGAQRRRIMEALKSGT